MFKKVRTMILSAFVFLACTLPAMAGDTLDISGGGTVTSVTNAQLSAILTKIGEGIAGVAGAAAFIMLVIFGIKMATAIDERARSEAVTGIRWTLIGVGVVALALTIIGFVSYVLSQA